MQSSAASLRVLGVSVPDVSDWREPLPQGQWSQFFGALAHRFELVDVVRPQRSRTEGYLNLARTFHPRRSQWKASAGFNQSLAMRRTQAVQRALAHHQGSYDLIMQLQTLCAPGFDRAGMPYAIYTDNTMALTRRLYPAWAPLSAKAASWWMQYEAEICRSATTVFTYSEFARRSVIDDYGSSPHSVIAVGAGANQLLGSLGNKDYTVARVLFVGFDFTRKGGSVLLEAWPIVRRRVPNAQLIVAGPTRESSPDLPAGVSWMGKVNRTELAQLYRSASVFVLPSLFEPWGHVFYEAMGHGLPCIGTSCCAMPEIIDDGVTGRLVPPSEPEPLADALIELLTDPVKTAAMGQAAYASVLRGNRWNDVLDRVAEHLAASPSVSARG
jgi:starch synthase